MSEMNKQLQRFYAHGKLMLSGEYLVLKGALSLAVPLKTGQELLLSEGTEDGLLWESKEMGRSWLKAHFDDELQLVSTSDRAIAERLQRLLIKARELNPDFLAQKQKLHLLSSLEFMREWGFGSSSTLVSNIASWAQCDPFALNAHVFGGSGYDIACAQASGPLLYQLRDGKPVWEELSFSPPFAGQLYLVWLNRKQDTRSGLARFDPEMVSAAQLEEVNNITREMLQCSSLSDFQRLLLQHEELIGKTLNQLPAGKRLFDDFPGVVKSLGAWGGDFVLAASDLLPSRLMDYFKQKGFPTVFRYNDLLFQS